MLKTSSGDFSPETKIGYESFYGITNIYTVLYPVRTFKGKLRLQGPRGGYTTRWWTKNTPNIRIIK